jgi:plastocyanin
VRKHGRNSVGGSGVAVRVGHLGIGGGLSATLLLIPLCAAANPSNEALATGAQLTPASVSESTGPAPIWIVKMNDDDPMYRPSTVQISVGQTVEWQNDGQVSHSVTDDPVRADKPGDALLPAGVEAFNSGRVMPGGRYRHTFTKPGRYRYFCLTHEGDRMIGEVIVEPQSAPPVRQVARSRPAAVHATPGEQGGGPPIQIVKMNDDEPMYSPSTVNISTGQTIEWENDGQVSHSVVDDPTRANQPADALLPAGVTPFNSGSVMPGGKFRHTFNRPGRYRYFCLTHEGDKMIGEVIVAPAASPREEQLAQSSQGTASPERRAPAPLKIVKIHDNDEPIYQPSSVQIVSGQTIEWKNEGAGSYSVTDDPARASDPVDALRPRGVSPFSSGSIRPGGSFRHTFTEPGRYRYFSANNSGDRMVGEVIVHRADNPEASESAVDAEGLSATARSSMDE